VVDLQLVVYAVVFLLVCGAVFGLLLWLIDYVSRAFPSEPMALFAKVARVALVVLAVLLLIAMLLQLAGLGPIFRWGPRSP
jgi:hypothetical protein